MPLPNTIDSYHRELEIFQQALNDPEGVRVCYGDKVKARQASFRFHQARALDRTESRRIYKPDDRLYGKSEFDVLVCKLREDADHEWWVYIERHGREVLAVESLSEVET